MASPPDEVSLGLARESDATDLARLSGQLGSPLTGEAAVARLRERRAVSSGPWPCGSRPSFSPESSWSTSSRAISSPGVKETESSTPSF